MRRLRPFLRELKRRKVYRVAALYAAGAFVLLQAADLLFRGLAVPDWIFSALVVLAVLGFPVALVLAWVFEIRPEGVYRTEDAPAADEGAAGTPVELSTRHLAVRYGVGLAVAAALVYASLTLGGVIGEADAAEIRSLAVLPPDNLSGDPGQAYFVEGMHDALIGELAQLPGLRVISRTSAMRYAETGKTAPEIADELDVDALVEGSVYRAGDSVRIQVQLIGARPEERHVWAKAYERELRQVLGIHGDVARQIAGEIGLALSPEEERRLAAARTVDPEAYEAYTRGMFHLNKFTPEGLERGLEHLNRAVEIDPDDPLPWAGLALGWALIGHGPGDPATAFPRAEEAADRALALDSLGGSGSARVALAGAWEALAEVRLYGDWDWPAAREAFERVLELNPNLAPAHAHYAWYLCLEWELEEAVEQMRRAARIDPLNPLWPAWEAWIHWEEGRFDRALELLDESLELNPDFPPAHHVRGGVLASMGRYEEAIEAGRAAGEASPAWRWSLGHTLAVAGRREEALELASELAEDPRPIETWGLARLHAGLGREEEALDWLERARDARWSWVPWIARVRAFAPLHDRPRFREMVEGLDLPSPRHLEVLEAGA